MYLNRKSYPTLEISWRKNSLDLISTNRFRFVYNLAFMFVNYSLQNYLLK